MADSKELKLSKEIALLERKLKRLKSAQNKALLQKVVDKKKLELKNLPLTAKQVANNLFRAREKVLALASKDFYELLRQLMKKPEYKFLRNMSKPAIRRDMKRKAKPVGWRFKGRGNYKVPNKTEIAKGKRDGSVYYETRPNRSDVSLVPQLEQGGSLSSTEKKIYDFLDDRNEHKLSDLMDGSISKKDKELLFDVDFQYNNIIDWEDENDMDFTEKQGTSFAKKWVTTTKGKVKKLEHGGKMLTKKEVNNLYNKYPNELENPYFEGRVPAGEEENGNVEVIHINLDGKKYVVKANVITGEETWEKVSKFETGGSIDNTNHGGGHVTFKGSMFKERAQESGMTEKEYAEMISDDLGLGSGQMSWSSREFKVDGTLMNGKKIVLHQKGEFNMYGGPYSPKMQKFTVDIDTDVNEPITKAFTDYGWDVKDSGGYPDLTRTDIYGHLMLQKMEHGGKIMPGTVLKIDKTEYLCHEPRMHDGKYKGWNCYKAVFEMKDGERHLNYDKTKKLKNAKYMTNAQLAKGKEADDYFGKGGIISRGDTVLIKSSGKSMKVSDISKNLLGQMEFSGKDGDYLIGDIKKMKHGGMSGQDVKIELPILMVSYNDEEIKDFLKENNIKSKILGESSLGGGNYTVELKGKFEDLKNVLDDGDYGWDGDYEEDEIKPLSGKYAKGGEIKNLSKESAKAKKNAKYYNESFVVYSENREAKTIAKETWDSLNSKAKEGRELIETHLSSYDKSRKMANGGKMLTKKEVNNLYNKYPNELENPYFEGRVPAGEEENGNVEVIHINLDGKKYVVKANVITGEETWEKVTKFETGGEIKNLSKESAKAKKNAKYYNESFVVYSENGEAKTIAKETWDTLNSKAKEGLELIETHLSSYDKSRKMAKGGGVKHEIKVGDKIRSFDFIGNTDVKGENACYMEGIVLETNTDPFTGKGVYYKSKMTKKVFGGVEREFPKGDGFFSPMQGVKNMMGKTHDVEKLYGKGGSVGDSSKGYGIIEYASDMISRDGSIDKEVLEESMKDDGITNADVLASWKSDWDSDEWTNSQIKTLKSLGMKFEDGGKTKEPEVVRYYFEDEAYEYEDGGKTEEPQIVRYYFEDDGYEYGKGGVLEELGMSNGEISDLVENETFITKKLKSNGFKFTKSHSKDRHGQKIVIFKINNFGKGGIISVGDKVTIPKSKKRMTVENISKNAKGQIEFKGKAGTYLIGDIKKFGKGGCTYEKGGACYMSGGHIIHDVDDKAKLYFLQRFKDGAIDKLPDNPTEEYLKIQMKQEKLKKKYESGGKTDDWIQEATKEMKEDGTEGAFTKQAKRAGMSTKAFAKEVLSNPDKFTETTRKRAQFMKNTNPELFGHGGYISEGQRDAIDRFITDERMGLGIKDPSKYSSDELADMVVYGYSMHERDLGNELGYKGTLSPQFEQGIRKHIKSKYAKGGGVTKGQTLAKNLNKSDVAYQLAMDYSGNSKPKIVKLNKKEIHIKYGYKFPHEESIKSILKIHPDIELTHDGWSNTPTGGGIHKFKIKYDKGGKMQQGYNDRMDESLGMRHRGSHSQNLKDRRDEAKGMNKAMGDRAYQSVGTMDRMEHGGKVESFDLEDVKIMLSENYSDYFNGEELTHDDGNSIAEKLNEVRPGSNAKYHSDSETITYQTESFGNGGKTQKMLGTKLSKTYPEFYPTIKFAGDTLTLFTVFREDKDKNWDKEAQDMIDNERRRGRRAACIHKGKNHGLYLKAQFGDGGTMMSTGGEVDDLIGKTIVVLDKTTTNDDEEIYRGVASSIDGRQIHFTDGKSITLYGQDDVETLRRSGTAVVHEDEVFARILDPKDTSWIKDNMTRSRVDDVLFNLNELHGTYGDKVDGETLEFIISALGMTDQMKKQLCKDMMEHGGKMHQGYNDRMDESLGMRHRGSHSQGFKDRRDEAKGMNKAMGDRAYQSVGSMDKMEHGGEVSDRYMISIPYYGTQKEAEMYIKNLIKSSGISYASLHSQFEKDGYKTKFIKEFDDDNMEHGGKMEHGGNTGLKIGNYYSVKDDGDGEFRDDMEYLGYSENENAHIFRHMGFGAPGNNNINFMYVEKGDEKDMVTMEHGGNC